MLSGWAHLLPRSLVNAWLERPALRRIVSNMGWLVVERFIRMGLAFAVGVAVARHLGPDRFGHFSFVLSFVSMFAVAVGLGFDSLVVRDLVKDPSREGELLGTAAALRAAAAALAWILALGLVCLIRPEDPESQVLVAITCLGLLFQAFDPIDLHFQALLASRASVAARLVSLVVGSVAKIVAIAAHATLRVFAWVWVLEALVTAFGLFVAYRLAGPSRGRWHVRSATARSLITESWPLMLSGLAIVVYTRIDQVMLAVLSGDTAVGVFAAAVRLSEAWYFVPTVIVSSVAPALVEARQRDEALYLARLSRLFAFLARLAIALACLMTFLAGPLVAWCYGGRYEAASLVVAIHAWTAVFVFLGVAQGQWNVNEGLGHLLLKRTLLAAGLNILLNGVLIPRAGAAGAAIATVVSQAFAGVFANAFDSRTRGIFFLQIRAMMPWR